VLAPRAPRPGVAPAPKGCLAGWPWTGIEGPEVNHGLLGSLLIRGICCGVEGAACPDREHSACHEFTPSTGHAGAKMGRNPRPAVLCRESGLRTLHPIEVIKEQAKQPCRHSELLGRAHDQQITQLPGIVPGAQFKTLEQGAE